MSVRNKSDARKKQREAKIERKKLEKIQKTEEIKRLKNLKKEEIASKISLIQKFSGTTPSMKYLALPLESLEKDFDPNEYDTQMNEMFNDDYYNQEDSNPQIDDVEKIQENDIDILRIEKTEELPIGLKEGTSNT